MSVSPRRHEGSLPPLQHVNTQDHNVASHIRQTPTCTTSKEDGTTSKEHGSSPNYNVLNSTQIGLDGFTEFHRFIFCRDFALPPTAIPYNLHHEQSDA